MIKHTLTLKVVFKKQYDKKLLPVNQQNTSIFPSFNEDDDDDDDNLSVSPHCTVLRSTLTTGCDRTTVVVKLCNHADGLHEGEDNVDRTEVFSNRIRDQVCSYTLLA